MATVKINGLDISQQVKTLLVQRNRRKIGTDRITLTGKLRPAKSVWVSIVTIVTESLSASEAYNIMSTIEDNELTTLYYFDPRYSSTPRTISTHARMDTATSQELDSPLYWGNITLICEEI